MELEYIKKDARSKQASLRLAVKAYNCQSVNYSILMLTGNRA